MDLYGSIVYLSCQGGQEDQDLDNKHETHQGDDGGGTLGFRGFYKRVDPSIIMSKSNTYGRAAGLPHSAMGQSTFSLHKHIKNI